jgi:uncharacterized protein YoxC
MMMLAMWLQGADALSAIDTKLLIVFIGVVALALLVQAIALIVVSSKASKALTSMVETVDVLKQRSLPLIDAATSISRTTETLIRENSLKVRAIADNLVETSDTLVEASRSARVTIEQIGATVADANRRTQRQVARVDDMVSATLTATVEVTNTIINGVRVPAQKIATIASQAKNFAEAFFAKLKSATPFANR